MGPPVMAAVAAGPLVSAPVTLRLKSQPAVRMEAAGKGPLIGVDPHVGLEVAPTVGHLEANAALKVGLKAVRERAG